MLDGSCKTLGSHLSPDGGKRFKRTIANVNDFSLGIFKTTEWKMAANLEEWLLFWCSLRTEMLSIWKMLILWNIFIGLLISSVFPEVVSGFYSP